METNEGTARHCPGCGTMAGERDRFCTGCGATLEVDEVGRTEEATVEEDAPESSIPVPVSDTAADEEESSGGSEEQAAPRPSDSEETSTVENLGASVRRGMGSLSNAASGYAGRYGPQVAERLPAPVRRTFADLAGARAGSRASGDSRSDLLFGAIAAFVTAWSLLVLVYLFLALNGTLSSELVPGNLGFTVFSALHGGDVFASFSVPIYTETLDGGLSFGVPVTLFAVLVFGVALVIGRLFATRKSAGYGFALGFGLTYAVLCFLFALFGRVTVEEAFLSLSVYAGSVSTAFWALVLAVVGASAGVGSASGTRVAGGGVGRLLDGRGRWGLHARRAAEGALVAFLIGISPTLLFCLFDVLACGYGAVFGGEGACSGRGVFLTLLPTIAGSTWLLAHGVPIGAASSLDLGGLTGLASDLGASLPEIPTRLSLFGNWPFSDAWRLMVIVPVLALFAGGAVAARDSHRSDRIFQGALVCVPYTLVAVVVSLLVGITASVTIVDYAVEVALRVPAGYFFVILLIAALFGGVGGYFSDHPRVASLRRRAASNYLIRRVYGARERVR